MARAFVSASSQGLQSSTLALSSFNQMSISFWLKWTAFASDDKLAFELGPNANANAGTFYIDPNYSVSAGNFGCTLNIGGGLDQFSFSHPSSGVWHNYIFIFDGTQSGTAIITAVYVDGASQSLTFQGSSGAAGSFSNQVLNFMCRNQASLFGDGSMADVAIWAASSGSRGGALLTQTEATALARGIRPIQIRQSSLAYWWPIDGLASPEPDLGGTAKNATLTGSPALAFGPPFAPFTPRWPQGLDAVVVTTLPNGQQIFDLAGRPPEQVQLHQWLNNPTLQLPPGFVLMPQIVT